jgi:hypothetical protein
MSSTTTKTVSSALNPHAVEPATLAIHGPVVLASDGRARSDATALAARSIAERLGARIEVVSVLEPLPIYDAGFDAPLLPPEFERERRADQHARVCHRLEPLLGARDRWHVDLRYGAPGRVVAEAARNSAPR